MCVSWVPQKYKSIMELQGHVKKLEINYQEKFILLIKAPSSLSKKMLLLLRNF